MQNPVNRIRSWYWDIVAELKKCAWPSRQELAESTVVVIVSVLMLSVFVVSVDWLSGFLIRTLTTAW